MLPTIERRPKMLTVNIATFTTPAAAEGHKELNAVADGYRESEQSWKALLLEMKLRRPVVDREPVRHGSLATPSHERQPDPPHSPDNGLKRMQLARHRPAALPDDDGAALPEGDQRRRKACAKRDTADGRER
jgi:hypothetical protein